MAQPGAARIDRVVVSGGGSRLTGLAERLGAATRLPVSLFPHIDFPRVVVSVDAGERDPAQMAAQITRPVEIALRAVPGVSRLRSTTSRGSAEVALDFPWSQDMVAATLATLVTIGLVSALA